MALLSSIGVVDQPSQRRTMNIEEETIPGVSGDAPLEGMPRGVSSVGLCASSSKDRAARAKKTRDLQDQSMVLFLLDTGLQEDEIVRLDLNAIEFSARNRPDGLIETIGRGSISIPETGRHREFFLSARTVEALHLYWVSRRDDDDQQPVFTTRVSVRRLLKLIMMMIRGWCLRLVCQRA